MANTKISELTALGATPAGDDVLAIVDTSASSTKKVTVTNLMAAGGGATDIDGLSDGFADANSVGLGSGALSNDTGSTLNKNTALGFNALSTLTTGTQNVAVGFEALQDYRGSQSTAVGYRAGANFTTPSSNTAVGHDALFSGTTGGFNTGIGRNALRALTSSANNVAVGYGALQAVTTGTGTNTGVGVNAGENITTGTNNACFGKDATASSATTTNEITLGNSSIATLRCQVTTITSLSDARDKENIETLDGGLDLINALHPVRFSWNTRDGGKVGVPDTGFIAQELQSAQQESGVGIPGLVFDNNPDRLEAGYGKLIPVLVKAIQEQQEQIDRLTALLESK